MTDYIEKYKFAKKDYRLLAYIIKYNSDWTRISVPQKFSFLEFLSNINFFIPIYYSYTKSYLLEFLNAIKLEFYQNKSVIYSINDTMTHFYVQLTGSLSTQKSKDDLSGKIFNDQLGETFNFEQIKNSENYSNSALETLEALSDTYVIKVHYKNFEPFLKGIKEKDFIYFSRNMSKFPAFEISKTLKDTYQLIFQYFKTKIFNKDEIIIKQGQAIDKKKDGFYFAIYGKFLIQVKNIKLETGDSLKIKDFIKDNNKQDEKLIKFLLKIPTKENIKRIEKEKKDIETKNILFYKSIDNNKTNKQFKFKNFTSNLSYVGKLSIFGDIDYFLNSKNYSYQVVCKENDSIIYFVSYEDFDKFRYVCDFVKVLEKEALKKGDIYNHKAKRDNFVDEILIKTKNEFFKKEKIKEHARSNSFANCNTFYIERNSPDTFEEKIKVDPQLKSLNIIKVNDDNKLFSLNNFKGIKALSRLNEDILKAKEYRDRKKCLLKKFNGKDEYLNKYNNSQDSYKKYKKMKSVLTNNSSNNYSNINKNNNYSNYINNYKNNMSSNNINNINNNYSSYNYNNTDNYTNNSSNNFINIYTTSNFSNKKFNISNNLRQITTYLDDTQSSSLFNHNIIRPNLKTISIKCKKSFETFLNTDINESKSHKKNNLSSTNNKYFLFLQNSLSGKENKENKEQNKTNKFREAIECKNQSKDYKYQKLFNDKKEKANITLSLSNAKIMPEKSYDIRSLIAKKIINERLKKNQKVFPLINIMDFSKNFA